MKKAIVASLILSSLVAAGVVLAENNDGKLQGSVTRRTIDIACVARAVDTRETAITNAFKTYSDARMAALQTRKSELAAAWTMTDTDARNKAINAAWKKFNDAEKAARRTYNQTRKTAWEQFKKDRKACGSGPTGEDNRHETL